MQEGLRLWKNLSEVVEDPSLTLAGDSLCGMNKNKEERIFSF
jgi:hypothetical protein